MSGANSTAPEAHAVHGTNPQNLVERITRDKIYAMTYWKEKCFGVSAAALVDLAMEIREFGGVYGGTNRCTDFLCLVLKMLQIQPDKEIVVRTAARRGAFARTLSVCCAAAERSGAAWRLCPQVEFIKNEEYKYVRLLGAFYLRLVGKPLEVYQYLEARSRSRYAARPLPQRTRISHLRHVTSRCTTTTGACGGGSPTATMRSLTSTNS